MSVRVIDISMNGVLLSSREGVAVGSQAHLRTILGSDRFEAQVLIRRSAPEAGSATSVRLGGEFVGLDESNRRVIERFLRENRL
jgi:hypothetical protein